MSNTKTKDQYKRIISFLSACVLLLLLSAGFAFVWYVSYVPYLVLPFYRRGNWVVILIYTLITYLFFRVYNAWKMGYLKKTDLFYSQIIAVVCVNITTYFLICLIGRNFMEVSPLAWLTFYDIVVILAWIFLSNKVFFRLYPPRRLVIVYGSKSAADLVLKMSSRVDKYIICESIKYNECKEDIYKTILQFEGVIICDVPDEVREKILKFCYSHYLRVYISPKITDVILRGAEDVRLFDTPLVVCKNYGLTFEQKLIKRLFDLFAGIVMAIVAWPICLIIATAIKIDDGGKVFYKQERLTQYGKKFYVYKFRSMVENAEENGARLSCENDERVTRVGKFIRKCRLDELPQIWNIIKGDMSVVGPRPERPELAAEIEKEIPEFRFRLHVKAGLTGYAQVTGLYSTDPYDKLKMDLMYIENYSFTFDLQIIMMTIKTVFFPPNKDFPDVEVHDNDNNNKNNMGENSK